MQQKKPTVVKKYANRRLYDMGRSAYVTLDDLFEMIKEDYPFVVQDAKTGRDITRSVLMQIIVEKESKKDGHSFSLNFMKNLIRFYDSKLHPMLPHYIDQSMENFVQNKEDLSSQLEETYEHIFPFQKIETLNTHNLNVFQNALKAMTSRQEQEARLMSSEEE